MDIPVNEQVHLAAFAPGDEAALVTALNNPAIYERTLRIPYPYTESDARTWLAHLEQKTREQGRPVCWAIRDAGGRLIGGVGFDDFVAGQSHRAEIGYWLAQPYWGRGLMTAVVRRACDYAVAEWGLMRVVAHVFAGNAASARVLEKCGFEREGYLRKHFRKDGRLLDVWLYARVW